MWFANIEQVFSGKRLLSRLPGRSVLPTTSEMKEHGMSISDENKVVVTTSTRPTLWLPSSRRPGHHGPEEDSEMADDTEKPPVRMRKTPNPVSRHRSTSDGGETALEREQREQRNFIVRQRQEEIRVSIEAERRACEAKERARQEVSREMWLADLSADERDMYAFSEKFDEVVDPYFRQCCAAMPGFSFRPLILPPESRDKGWVFSFGGLTGWIQHNRRTALIERVSPGRRGVEKSLGKILTVNDLTTRKVERAVKEVLDIGNPRGAPDRKSGRQATKADKRKRG